MSGYGEFGRCLESACISYATRPVRMAALAAQDAADERAAVRARMAAAVAAFNAGDFGAWDDYLEARAELAD